MKWFAPRAALAVAAFLCTATSLHAAQAGRTTAIARYGLELDGTAVGFVTLAQGGNAVAAVVKEPAGTDPFVKKHIAQPGYRDIVIEFGADMAPAVFDWIKLTLQRQYAPKNGAVVALDFRYRPTSRLEFTGAQITEVTFPGADAASRNAGRFVLRLTPVFTTLNRTPAATPFSVPLASRTRSLSENLFTLTINGISGLQGVTKVEQITVSLPLLVDPSAVCLHCEPTPPPPVDFPSIVFTLADSRADSVYQWFNDFVLNGNSDDAAERTGTLSYLTSTGGVRFALNFFHLGIFEVASNTDTAQPTVTVSMYCEQIAFEHFPSTP
jgi:hypothetical protein